MQLPRYADFPDDPPKPKSAPKPLNKPPSLKPIAESTEVPDTQTS